MSTEVPLSPPPTRPTTGSLASFLDELLAEQQRLHTPVVRAGAAHDQLKITVPESKIKNRESKTFSDLIPLTAPGPGEQYAFEVDLDACSGCKACVSACHSLNGLDETEAWRDVGLIHGGTTAAPYQQTITSACHHCADPGCLNGCPVVAYEKDPVTGIVRHLDDQCIGCSYCILKCPYDVPKFNDRLGIVRKCDMCQQRLAVGEAPACAQACPTHAISIIKVSTTATNADFLAVAPDPAYTRPTTHYISNRELPANTTASDANTLYVQHAHTPLVVMLTLTQLGTGLLATAPRAGSSNAIAITGAALFFTGLGTSVLHLGQPSRAWRFFMGLRTSWLSREILAFNFLAPLALATLLWPGSVALHAAFAVTAFVAIACSAMIYIDTRRRFWAPAPSFVRFLGTAAIAAAFFVHPLVSITLLAAKLTVEITQSTGSSISARLQRGPLKNLLFARLALAAGSVIALLAGQSWIAFASFAAGELAERSLFFMATDSPKMPGHPANL